jgi:hypothetical protein
MQLDFGALRQVYASFPPLGFRETGPEYYNTCAVRLADAITRVAPDFFSGGHSATWPDNAPTGRYVPAAGAVGLKFQPAPPNRKLPVRASEIADILNGKLGMGRVVRTAADVFRDRGIIFFEGIPGYSGTGHITLWEAGKAADNGEYWNSRRVVFWRL